MAATGKTPILLYGSTTTTNQPSAGNLTNSSDGCEIAINVADKNLFFKDATNTVNTVPIRQSSASSDGWLSSTDWSTFNSKQPAGTYVTSVTGTAPVVSSGGTTPAISMAAATGSVNGYLTSTDWTTFNSKQAALVSGTNIKTVSGTSLLGSGDVGTIGTGYGGTGLTSFTANQVFYASSTSAIAQSSNLQFDGSTLAAGTSIAAWGGAYGRMQIGTALSMFSNGASIAYFGANFYNAGAGVLKYINNGASTKYVQNNGTHSWDVASSGSANGTITYSTAMSLSAASVLTVTGNVTSPAFVPNSSTIPTNGLYLPAANSIGIATNSTNAIYIDSNQNVGIGATPNAWSNFKVMQTAAASFAGYSSNNNAYIGANYYGNGTTDSYINNGYASRLVLVNGGMQFQTAPSGTAGNAITFTQAMTLFQSGGVSIGNTTDPGAGNLFVNGTLTSGTTSTANLWDGTSTGNFKTYQASNNRACIQATSSDSALILSKLTSNSTDLWFIINNSSSTNNLIFGGGIQATSSYVPATSMTTAGVWYQGNNSASWSTTSDIRIKENIRPVGSALEKMMALKPCHFEYKTRLGKVKTGFIAQEFEQVFPGHVTEELPDDEYKNLVPEGDKIKGIDMDLIPYLVAAIQEQQLIIEQLKEKAGLK